VRTVADRPVQRARPARAPIGPAWLRRPIPLTLLGGLVAAVLGLNLAERKPHASSTPIAFNRTAAIAGAHVTYPSNWVARPAPSEPDLPLRHGVALTARTPPAVTLVLGMTSASVASPLPDGYLASQVPGTPTPETVALGRHRFARVLDPRLSLGGPAKTVYGLATRTGTFVAICATRSRTQVARCEQVLGTLSGVQPPHTMTSAVRAYLIGLNAALGRLNRARTSDGHALATARTAAAQAKAAASLATAHEHAATAVGRLAAHGALAAAGVSLIGSLRRASRSYSALAAAATRSDGRAYAAAQRAVGAANAAVDQALAGVRARAR
jgi:hypothetical protein